MRVLVLTSGSHCEYLLFCCWYWDLNLALLLHLNLNYASSPFYFRGFCCCLFVSCFLNKGLEFLPGASLDPNPPTYSLLYTWDHWCMPPCPASLLRLGLTNFLSRLALNLDPPDLPFPFSPSSYHCTHPHDEYLNGNNVSLALILL
jgi:hypothetical protein